MKIYKKFMDILATIEKIVLALATLLIVVITVGNVLSRYLIHRSWSFTEELVVAVFVLITLLAAALACRDGELVSLSIFTDMLPQKSRKFMVILMTVLSVIFTVILFKYGNIKYTYCYLFRFIVCCCNFIFWYIFEYSSNKYVFRN